MCRCEGQAETYIYYAALGHQLAVRITSSLSPSSSGTKPLPPHVGHCCSSSLPFSMMPSPLHSGQVFTCDSLWTPRRYYLPQTSVPALNIVVGVVGRIDMPVV